MIADTGLLADLGDFAVGDYVVDRRNLDEGDVVAVEPSQTYPLVVDFEIRGERRMKPWMVYRAPRSRAVKDVEEFLGA